MVQINADSTGRLYAHELCGFSFWERMRGRLQKAIDILYTEIIHWHVEDR